MQVPAFTTDGTRLEEVARGTVEPGPFGYVAGGAGSGATVRANREAFDRWRIVPRMLADATQRDLSTTVLGTEMPAPVLLAPVGVQSILHPDGELATARVAAELGVPMILSTAASYTDRGCRGVQWGRSAVVPAVLAQRQRRDDQHPVAGQGRRVHHARADARHVDAGVAHHRPRPVVPAVHPRRRHRHPVLRPRFPRGPGEVAGGGPAVGDPALDPHVHRDRQALGPAAVPARALGRADRVEGHPARRRRAPRPGRGHGRHRRVQPRWPAGRRGRRVARGAARDRGRGR